MIDAHDRLVAYLASTGWIAPAEAGPSGGLWKRPGTDLLLPVPHELVDGGLDWQLVVERLAEVEKSSEAEVASRLGRQLADVANIRAANDLVIRDTIPYATGVTMVRESWTMLRAAATTSLGQKAHIRRFRQSADSIIGSARMAHTRRGSFIIPIYLPLPDPEKVADVLPSPGIEIAVPESQERRVMRTFAEALAAVDELAVKPDREPNANEIQELIRSGVSHEFAASLRRVLTEEAVASFGATFEWALSGGPAPQTPTSVNIPAAASEAVKRVSERLRQAPASQQPEYLTGPIVGVHRDDEDRSGVVTVQVSRHSRPAHVSVNVSRERLDEALDWMKARATVVVQSKVHRTSSGLIADSRDAVSTLASHQLSTS
jgi:hypothetical protein